MLEAEETGFASTFLRVQLGGTPKSDLEAGGFGHDDIGPEQLGLQHLLLLHPSIPTYRIRSDGPRCVVADPHAYRAVRTYPTRP